MAPRNKQYRLFDKFKALLTGRTRSGHGQTKIGVKTKVKVLAFYQKHNRWPSCRSKNVAERKLGRSFENYMSKESLAFDLQFRRIAMALGRKSNHKGKHDVKGFKKKILQFIKDNGRVPTTYSGAVIEGEGALRSKLDYYTQVKNDMTLLGEVYKLDKCHKSAIPAKFRPTINANLDIDKPLIRMVK